MVRRRTLPAAALGAAVLLSMGACGKRTPTPVRLAIATGSKTGVYYVFGKAYAEIVQRELPQVHAEVLVTKASAENVQLVGDGRAQLGFTQADILPFTGNKVMAVARVYDDLLHLVTRSDGPVRAVDDLKGRRVSVGAAGSGTAITANRVLDVAELSDNWVTVSELGLDASAAALRRGEIDAFFFSGGPPVKAVEQLASALPIRLVELGTLTDRLRNRYREVYVSRDIPSSVYGLSAISTVADPNYLVVPIDMADELVFELTRLLMEHRDELGVAHPAAGRMNPQSAISTPPLPLHPGAARYYQSIKP